MWETTVARISTFEKWETMNLNLWVFVLVNSEFCDFPTLQCAPFLNKPQKPVFPILRFAGIPKDSGSSAIRGPQ